MLSAQYEIPRKHIDASKRAMMKRDAKTADNIVVIAKKAL